MSLARLYRLLLVFLPGILVACGGGSGANLVPSASIEVAVAAKTGYPVTLDGRGSSDADKDVLNFTWTIDSVPAGSNVTAVANTHDVLTFFTPDVNGDYVITLVVTDGVADSAPVSVTISASSNSLPTASAGTDQSVITGSLVSLDGSSSLDADGDLITYSWRIDSVPVGSGVTALSDNTLVNPQFTVDVDGVYTFSLVVNDGYADSAVDSVSITAAAANAAPVANAGVDQNVNTASLVTLDGSASSDADANPLSYTWTINSIPTGSAVSSLSDATAVKPTFTPDIDGSYVFSLVVNDGIVNSAADIVTVNATTANVAPVANAGTDQSVLVGDVVNLDGSASSDSNGDTITYQWSFVSRPAGSNVALSDIIAVQPSFTPDMAGTYVIALVVNDGQLDSAVDQVSVTAASNNTAPVASAGADQSVLTASVVTLDGTGSSDADGDALTYQWTINSVPAGSSVITLSDVTVSNPVFTPDVAGDYVFTLVVNDGSVDSTPASVVISASVANAPPVANAGADQNVIVGTLVTLDGGASSDANGDTLSYRWSVVSLPLSSGVSALSGATSMNPSFTPDVKGAYVFSLVVNDGTVDSAADNVAINANTPPVANAGADQSVATGTVVTLDGSASSDADGDSLTYTWSMVSTPAGSSASLSSTSAVNPQFTADLDGSYEFSLVVSDGTDSSVTDSIIITASTPNTAPVADAQSVTTDEDTAIAITLTGSDVDGDSLSYTVVSGPSSGALSGTAPNLVYTPNSNFNGSDSFTFMVNDGIVDSGTVTISITINAINDAPVANSQVVSTNQDVAVNFTLSGSDVEGSALSYTVVTGPVNGVLSGTAPNLTYTPNPGFSGTDSFSFVVNDGTVNSASATVNITVVDTVAPVTTYLQAKTVTPSDRTYVITLTASEPGTTWFRFDTGDLTAGGSNIPITWQVYTGPVTMYFLKGVKVNFEFYSEDLAGNVELTQSRILR